MIPTREDDERLLRWLAKRTRGVPVSKIAASVGFTRQHVYQCTEAVRKADEKYCGKRLPDYWK